jgi:cell surface protein SprA
MKITLEPWPTVKIDLNASRNRNRSHSIQYMFSGMPTTESGSFSMTTVSIGSAFEGVGSASNGYRSATFTKFVNLLDSYRDRVEAKYAGSIYPEGTSLAGETFNPANGTVSKYAAEVMIPAFLEAYTGNKDSDIFPSFASIFPNWNFTYSGLIKLPAMQNIFKSFNINHSYKSVYNVGSYNSFSSYHEYMNGIGFITDVSTGNPTPSCPFDISAVSINESFSPLIGVDMAFHNGLTAKVEYRKTRVLTLSMTSQQLNETHSNDFIIGVGYKIADFKMFKPKGKVRRVKAKQTTRDEAGNTKTSGSKTNASGFSQDLNLRLDISLRDQAAIGRDILTQRSEATSGNKAVQIKFSADYAFSKFVTLTAYYDRQFNEPLLTSSSYPTTTQDFGVTVKFKLTR